MCTMTIMVIFYEGVTIRIYTEVQHNTLYLYVSIYM